MLFPYQIGDLVHIPQSVELIDYDPVVGGQLNIPLRVVETKEPKLGVVTAIRPGSYIQIYCEGDRWTVKHNNVYKI